MRQDDIDWERIWNDNNANSSDGYIETVAVNRGISEQMPFHDIFLFHGSAIALDGEAYLFTANRGMEKSTHTALWRIYLGDIAVMVNAYKHLIRITDDQTIVSMAHLGRANIFLGQISVFI